MAAEDLRGKKQMGHEGLVSHCKDSGLILVSKVTARFKVEE